MTKMPHHTTDPQEAAHNRQQSGEADEKQTKLRTLSSADRAWHGDRLLHLRPMPQHGQVQRPPQQHSVSSLYAKINVPMTSSMPRAQSQATIYEQLSVGRSESSSQAGNLMLQSRQSNEETIETNNRPPPPLVSTPSHNNSTTDPLSSQFASSRSPESSSSPLIQPSSSASSSRRPSATMGDDENAEAEKGDSDKDETVAADEPLAPEGKNTRFKFTRQELEHLAENYTQEEVANMKNCSLTTVKRKWRRHCQDKRWPMHGKRRRRSVESVSETQSYMGRKGSISARVDIVDHGQVVYTLAPTSTFHFGGGVAHPPPPGHQLHQFHHYPHHQFPVHLYSHSPSPPLHHHQQQQPPTLYQHLNQYCIQAPQYPPMQQQQQQMMKRRISPLEAYHSASIQPSLSAGPQQSYPPPPLPHFLPLPLALQSEKGETEKRDLSSVIETHGPGPGRRMLESLLFGSEQDQQKQQTTAVGHSSTSQGSSAQALPSIGEPRIDIPMQQLVHGQNQDERTMSPRMLESAFQVRKEEKNPSTGSNSES